jgi:pimeloyl-ACP methyl ester carboxylesterase
MLSILPRLILSTLIAGILCQCGVPTPPQCRKVPAGSRAPAADLLAEARAHWQVLANPARKNDWPAATSSYNAAVAKLFDQLRCGPNTWDDRATMLGTQIHPDSQSELHPARLDALFPASLVDSRTVRTRQTTAGVGVPLVGWRVTTPVGVPRAPFQLPNGQPSNLTASLSFNGGELPTWRFTKRWNHDDLAVGRTRHILAADWTAPNAFFWKMSELDDLTFQNVFLPDRFTEETGIYFVTPYDPEKIPLVLVHGLVSSPDAFKNLINELSPHPWFRENYQIWLYNYPTGNPWIFSSMRFRDIMRETCSFARSKGHDQNLRRMVVVGHSMGGLVTRSSITHPGTAIYDEYFPVPIDQLKVGPDTKNLIKAMTLYEPLDEPSRVVFMAVPHRGSPLANMAFANWISRLIRLPKLLTVELLDNAFQTVEHIAEGDEPAEFLPTSINSLSPTNRANLALNKLPPPDHVTIHSVVGDRGRGDSPDSSDGVVPYWSSHLKPVHSELVVPANHSVQEHPEAAAELKRILQLHLQDPKP